MKIVDITHSQWIKNIIAYNSTSSTDANSNVNNDKQYKYCMLL